MEKILKFLTLYSFYIVYSKIFVPRDTVSTLISSFLLCFFGMGIIFFHFESVKKIFINKIQILFMILTNAMIIFMSYVLIIGNNSEHLSYFFLIFVLINSLSISLLSLINEMLYEKILFYQNFDFEENTTLLNSLKEKIKKENDTKKLLELTGKFNKLNVEIENFNYYSKINFYKKFFV